MRAKQPRKFFIDSADRPLVGHRRPDQPVHLLHRLNLRFDDTHLNFTITPAELCLYQTIVYNTVVLGSTTSTSPFRTSSSIILPGGDSASVAGWSSWNGTAGTSTWTSIDSATGRRSSRGTAGSGS